MKSATIRTIMSTVMLMFGIMSINAAAPPREAMRISSARFILIKEIMVTNETDGFGSLEVEVHIFERAGNTVRFLGCSGQNSGLRGVDVSGTNYIVNAFFQKPPKGEGRLTYEEVKDKTIFIQVIEDDFGPCPGELVFGDDHIGTSANFSGGILTTPQKMQFDNVPNLVIAIGEPVVLDNFTKVVLGDLPYDSVACIGSAWGDYNNDGQIDLFVSNANNKSDLLYVNNGRASGSRFDKIKNGIIVKDSSDSQACAWGDFDNDGDLDLFVLSAPRQLLYRNDGAGFTKLLAHGINTDSVRGTACSWADYNNDGFLDLFISNPSGNNFLFKNQIGTGFTKIADGPVVNDGGASRGCAWGDYDNDGDADLFVANYSEKNFLYRNNGDGAFAKITNGEIVNSVGAWMGASWGDYNQDGFLDLLVTNEAGANVLYRNNGAAGTGFTNVAAGDLTNVASGASRGSSWGDYDNDGDLDMVIARYNGDRNVLYNNKGNGTFTQIMVGDIYYDLGKSNGASWCDFDNDGDLDLLITNEGVDFLYSNDGYNNHWINLKCIGRVSNKSAIGAKVRAKAVINGQPRWQMLEIAGQTGFSAQNSLNAEFGLGTATRIDSIKIQWPSGVVDVRTNVNVDQFLVIAEGSVTTVTERENNPPVEFMLGQNYPNPFNPSTTLKYDLPQQAEVRLKIFDVQGRHVRTLVNQPQPAGRYAITWDGRNERGESIASGVYLYQLRAGTFAQTRRMALVR